MARFLVTGGCGFIGSHLVDELVSRGHNVRALDDLSTGKLENLPPDAEFVRGSITDRQAVVDCASGIDGIFHLAAISSVSRTTEEWLECHAINLTGTINIFDAASRMSGGPIPVVYASSAAVYGNCSAPAISESEPPDPISAYGADKRGCELHARIATLLHGVPTFGLRLFNVYGPRQDPASPYAGVISIFVNRMRQDLPVDIFGNGEQVRDFVFVSDVVRFFIASMDEHRARGGIVNVCTGQGTSIMTLAKIVGDLCGNEPRINYMPERQGDILHSVGNPERAWEALGCKAETTIRDGLKRTLNLVDAGI